MPKKDEIETVDELRTVDETVTDTPTGGTPITSTEATAALPPPTEPAPPTTDTADADEADPYYAGACLHEPEREAMYLRQSALALAATPGLHEAKEPILAVLARAEAYRAYMETGETGIVA